MPYKNLMEFLADATKYPAAIEAMLPEAAPKISETLATTAGRLSGLPDFPIEIPGLPEPPKLPEVGALRLGRPRGVKEVGSPRGVKEVRSSAAVTKPLGEEILS